MRAVQCFWALALFLAWPCAARAQSQAQPPTPLTLLDVTARTHIHAPHLYTPEKRYIVDSMSGGVALIDYDRDGWPDIYLTNAPDVETPAAERKARSTLWHNNHDGTFTDVTEKAGVGYPCWAMGAAVGDPDGDGWPDLLVTCFGGVVLYRNNGDGTFTDTTRATGLGADAGWATGASFGDYDGDGREDLFVPHYVALDLADLPSMGSKTNCVYFELPVQCGPRGLPGSPDSLYRNAGNGRFLEEAKAAGVDDAQKFFGLQSLWLRGEGGLSLFVANDGEANYLYRPNGKGRFTESALESGVAVNRDGVEQANMGVAVGDYAHTGRLSLAVSHFSGEYTTLFRNDGSGTYTDVSAEAGIAQPTAHAVGWGIAFVDLDNDGWADLIQANGHVYPQVDSKSIGTSYREPMTVFVNKHDGTFADVSSTVGAPIARPAIRRGLAVGDLWNDGHMEIVVESLDGEPEVLRPAGPAADKNHWLGLALASAQGDRLALNARVTVTAGELRQVDEVRSSGSYLSQNDMRLHFGLGAHGRVDSVEIAWPDGKQETVKNLAADHIYTLLEGAGVVPAEKARPAPR